MTRLKKYTKAILAAAFGLPPAVVVGILAAAGVHMEVATVVLIIGGLSPLLAAAGVAVGPANQQ